MKREQDAAAALRVVDPAGVGSDARPEAVPAPAVLCVVGLPGALSGWCGRLVARLAGGDGDAAVFTANSLADIGRRLLDPAPLPAVAIIHCPDTGLCEALLADGCRFALLHTSPEAAVEALVREHGVAAAEAVRMIANAQATTARLHHAPGALPIGAGDLAGGAAARALAAHFGLPFPPADMPPPPPRADAAAQAAPTEPDWHRLVGAALAGAPAAPLPASALARAALRPPAQGRRTALTWPRDLFWTGAPQAPAVDAIDLTGPGRCVLHGPYIRLPAGPWSCALLFGCSREAVGLSMAADIHAGRVLNQAGFTIEEPGIFEIEIPFENPDPDALVEVRLFSTRAAFEGRIAIGRAAMTPLPARRLKVG